MSKFIKDYFKKDLNEAINRMKNAQELIESNIDKNLDEISIFDAITISGGGMFSPQKRTVFLEDRMKHMFSWKTVNPLDERGDYLDTNNKHFELKCSSTNDSNTINVLQLRPWQDVDYYRIIYFDLNDSKKSKSYVLSRDEMLEEIKKYGQPTHGTKNANMVNNKIEYGFHLPIENEWDNKYLDNNFFFNENRI